MNYTSILLAIVAVVAIVALVKARGEHVVKELGTVALCAALGSCITAPPTKPLMNIEIGTPTKPTPAAQPIKPIA